MEFGKEAVAEHLVKNNMPRFKDWKLDLSGAIDGMMDFNTKLDEIVRDIQKRKDNAMAMEFTKDIGDLLKKNGVCPKFEEYSDRVMSETKIEMRYGVSLTELDFTEHDKVFEEQIAKLEEELYRATKEIRQEKHKRELTEWERQELKQRIAELESEKSEKPTEINFNDQIKVKLTPLGVEIYYHQYDDLNESIKKNGGTPLEPRMPQIDKDGYTKFTLWHFMELYGQHIGMCKPNVVSPLYIELCPDEWKIRYDKEPIEKMEKTE